MRFIFLRQNKSYLFAWKIRKFQTEKWNHLTFHAKHDSRLFCEMENEMNVINYWRMVKSNNVFVCLFCHQNNFRLHKLFPEQTNQQQKVKKFKKLVFKRHLNFLNNHVSVYTNIQHHRENQSKNPCCHVNGTLRSSIVSARILIAFNVIDFAFWNDTLFTKRIESCPIMF